MKQPREFKTDWGPGTIIQNDARLSGRDPLKWLIIKRYKSWVLMVAVGTGWAKPPTKKMRQRDFDFMVNRGAFRFVKKVSLRKKNLQQMIKSIIDQEFPELLREVEEFV